MSLLLQDPTNNDSPSLHEFIVGAFENAVSGGGAFAFVTTGGVQLCFEDELFKNFIDDRFFDLVVGIDAVTNLRTIENLNTLIDQYPNFSVQAFCHTNNQYTFHPKFCWFRNNDGGILIIGSGNLTVNGLRNNWESFSVINLTNEEVDSIEETWISWKTNSDHFLKALIDPDVRARAQANVFRRATTTVEEEEQDIETEEAEEEFEHPEDNDPWQFNDESAVLLAEIPRGGNRWNQANFNQDSFENFFGGERWNNNYRILLREVDDDGGFNQIENRQAVSVKSHNWRFELGAAANLPYPDNGRPIGIFIKGIGIRTFLYVLAMPESEYYQSIDDYLGQLWNGRADRMRRVQIEVEDLREKCPELPFWSIGD